MENQSILKQFIKYVTLSVLGMLGFSFYILADTYFISKAMGVDGLASLNYAISFFVVIQAMGLLIGVGGATKFAFYKAEGNIKRCNTIFFHCLAMIAVFASIMVVLAIFFITPLCKLLGANGSTLPLTVSYLRTLMFFSVFFMLNHTMSAFVRNDNNPNLAMVAVIVSSLSNVVGDYILIFTFDMGMLGAALATAISPLISLSIISIHFIRKKNSFKVVVQSIKAKYLISISRLGFTAFIGEIATGVALLVFNLTIFNLTGNTGVAAYGIIANVAIVLSSIFTGISQGVQPLASRYYGEKKHKDTAKVLKYAIITTLGMSVICYLIVYLNTHGIVRIFNEENSQLLEQLTVYGMRIYFIGYFFAGLNIVIASFLSSVNRALPSFIVAILRSVVILVPSIIIMGMVLEMTGVWLSFVVTEFIVCFVAIKYVRHN